MSKVKVGGKLMRFLLPEPANLFILQYVDETGNYLVTKVSSVISLNQILL